MKLLAALLVVVLVVVVAPGRSARPPTPGDPVFGPSYVVTDVETLEGQTIDAIVPAPYVLGTYVRGGYTDHYGVSKPCPLGDYTTPAGNPGSAANALDLRWVHQGDPAPEVVWDLGTAHAAVIVFPSIDHGPFPEEGIEYTVWGSDVPGAAFPDDWTLGTLVAIYSKGWQEDPACSGTESDDWAAEYSFGFEAFQYIAVISTYSITIFSDPSHTSWESNGDDNSWDGWQSGDMEIDGVGAPVCPPGTPAADAGPDQVVHIGDTVQFDGTGSTGDIRLYGWDTDGDGVIDLTGPGPTKTFATPFDGDVTLTVVDANGCRDVDVMHLAVVSNRAPTISSFTATTASEGSPVELTVVASDPDNDALEYIYDFESDGVFDLDTAQSTVTHVYGDDFAGDATVRVTDGEAMSDATAHVVVTNVPPTLSNARVFIAMTVSLRIAGEKWHDVRLELADAGIPVEAASITRVPGSPDAQTLSLTSREIDVMGHAGLEVSYTPEDDPVNGRPTGDTPAWVILTYEDGSDVRLHHNFNVRHPSTWSWSIDDLPQYAAGKPITIEVVGGDPGSDDLTFTFDFADGTMAETTVFNNGASPDPYSSPDVNPIAATIRVAHAFPPGTYPITVTLRDDDGGSSSLTLVVSI